MARRANLRDLFGYVVVRLLLGVLGYLPERIAYGIGGAAGRLFFSLSERRRRIALDNLRQAMGPGRSDRDLLKMASTATGNIFKMVVDLARLARWGGNGRWVNRVDVQGILHCVPGGGRPFILISPHIGSWEVGLAAMSRTGLKISVIARQLKNPLLDKDAEMFRGSLGVEVYPRRGGMRYAVDALRRGRCLIALPDQNQRNRGIFVPFFGKLASTERSIAALAVRMDLPILTCSVVRVGKGFRFTSVANVIRAETTGDRAKDIEDLTVRMNRELERYILDHPEQYFWIHDRYRTRPPEEKAWQSQALDAAQSI